MICGRIDGCSYCFFVVVYCVSCLMKQFFTNHGSKVNIYNVFEMVHDYASLVSCGTESDKFPCVARRRDKVTL